MRFFPAYTFRDVLAMRARHFFALNKQIGIILKEEEARALSITHSGKPGERIKELISEINAERGIRDGRMSAIALIQRGEAKGVPSEVIRAQRERQKQSADAIKQDRQAWLSDIKKKLQEKNSLK